MHGEPPSHGSYWVREHSTGPREPSRGAWPRSAHLSFVLGGSPPPPPPPGFILPAWGPLPRVCAWGRTHCPLSGQQRCGLREGRVSSGGRPFRGMPSVPPEPTQGDVRSLWSRPVGGNFRVHVILSRVLSPARVGRQLGTGLPSADRHGLFLGLGHISWDDFRNLSNSPSRCDGRPSHGVRSPVRPRASPSRNSLGLTAVEAIFLQTQLN